ncbi:uncharacterized protein SCHCODRAFT_02497106 [Schizophyllum commune H4-8]|nr:uncharacterized protein SCHCODRAFT_02497106 [Schizophyllum commune H4-8]KAI5894452.1 hypothetical protein SCHCODRAFT_02497106 [Schizophyllum commune H4-8]
MLGISPNFQDPFFHLYITISEIYRAYILLRRHSEVIDRDDDLARTPDRRAGPVIRRARSARLFTSDHHHAASIASPASPPPPPSPPSQRVAQAEKPPLRRPERCTRRCRDPDNHQRPRARGGGSGCVNTPRIRTFTNFYLLHAWRVVGRRRMLRDGEQSGAE